MSERLQVAIPLFPQFTALDAVGPYEVLQRTGSLVLGAAGLLRGRTATTHWSCYPELEVHGAIAVPQRVVEHLD